MGPSGSSRAGAWGRFQDALRFSQFLYLGSTLVEPLVSILIPAYNAESWIAHSIQSAVAQTWPRKEIIVVDDGSSDQTLAVARQFESEMVQVVSQPNQGASAARNHALRLAQGDYIQWLDADDLLAADKIERQLRAGLDRGGSRTLLSSSWAFFRSNPSKAAFKPTALWEDLSPVDYIVRSMRLNLWMAIQCWLVSRELTEIAGPFDVQLLRDNDGEYFSRIICASDRICFVPEAKSYVRRANPGSISSDGAISPKKLDSIFRSVSLQIQRLRRLQDTEETRAACLAYLERYSQYFYPHREDLLMQAKELARELGGELRRLHPGWKRRLVYNLFGAKTGARIAGSFRRMKVRLLLALETMAPRTDREPVHSANARTESLSNQATRESDE